MTTITYNMFDIDVEMRSDVTIDTEVIIAVISDKIAVIARELTDKFNTPRQAISQLDKIVSYTDAIDKLATPVGIFQPFEMEIPSNSGELRRYAFTKKEVN